MKIGSVLTIIITLASLVYANQARAQVAISAGGVIESSTGGFKFPDGTVQETATPRGLCGKVNALSNLTCSSEISTALDNTGNSQIGGSCSDGNCYNCGTPNSDLEQTGSEHIYSFKCQATGEVTVYLDNLSCDLDVYTLTESSCGFFSGTSSISCVSGDTTVGTATVSNVFSCEAGVEYHIIVENVLNLPSCNYDIFFDIAAGTGCREHCTNGIDDDSDSDTDCDDSDCALNPVCMSP